MTRTSRGKPHTRRLDWKVIVARAATVAESYTTKVTLRQLHYRLFSIPGFGFPNTEYAYKRLSKLTAEARREGCFPPLADLTRSLLIPLGYDSPADALLRTVHIYRRDRTEGQEIVPMLLVEKATVVAQLEDWFGKPLGIPIAALRGYHSESYEREIRDYLEHRGRGRRFAAIYLGDFDPTGEDIERNARRYLGDCFASWERVAITPEIIDAFGLPEDPGKKTDSRAKEFAKRHGRLVQVEIEALDPPDFHRLVEAAIAAFWDTSQFEACLEREQHERVLLRELAERHG